MDGVYLLKTVSDEPKLHVVMYCSSSDEEQNSMDFSCMLGGIILRQLVHMSPQMRHHFPVSRQPALQQGLQDLLLFHVAGVEPVDAPGIAQLKVGRLHTVPLDTYGLVTSSPSGRDSGSHAIPCHNTMSQASMRSS